MIPKARAERRGRDEETGRDIAQRMGVGVNGLTFCICIETLYLPANSYRVIRFLSDTNKSCLTVKIKDMSTYFAYRKKYRTIMINRSYSKKFIFFLY